MQTRKASIKESGEELTQADWERFDAAVAQLKAERIHDGTDSKAEGPTPLALEAQAVA